MREERAAHENLHSFESLVSRIALLNGVGPQFWTRAVIGIVAELQQTFADAPDADSCSDEAREAFHRHVRSEALRRKEAEHSAEEQYRELVEREVGGKPGDDAKTLAHVADVPAESGRTVEDFEGAVDRMRERRELERTVARAGKVRKHLSKVRAELAGTETAFDGARTKWEGDKARLEGSVRVLQLELGALGKARDWMRREFPNSAVAKQFEIDRASARAEERLPTLRRNKKILGDCIESDETELKRLEGTGDVGGFQELKSRLADLRRRHEAVTVEIEAAQSELQPA